MFDQCQYVAQGAENKYGNFNPYNENVIILTKNGIKPLREQFLSSCIKKLLEGISLVGDVKPPHFYSRVSV